MQSNSVVIFGIIWMLALAGCSSPFFQKSEPVPNKIWEADNTIRFDLEVIDTVTGYDFYIDLRNESTYKYANIYMFVNTTFPSGKSARDTVECILADRTGRWLGTGLGDILDNHILFKENVRFPNSGTYSFEFENGMREKSLASILDVGISLEKHRKK